MADGEQSSTASSATAADQTGHKQKTETQRVVTEQHRISLRVDDQEYQLRKRLPRKLPRRPNDVYVNNKTNFKAQLVRCERLFESGYTELFIHGLGAASPRAINLALQLNINHRDTLALACNTSTQRVVDDLVPRDQNRPARTQELTQWLGLTPFEIWLHLAAALVFSCLVVVRDLVPHALSWWHVMSPLFVCDALCAYFSVIMLIRTYIDGWYKPAAMRALWSFFVLALLFTFKYLLVRKLSGSIAIEYSEVMAPLFVMLNMVMVRACQL